MLRKITLSLILLLSPLLVLAQPSTTFVLAVSDDTSTVYTTHLGFVGADVSKLGYKGIITITAGGAPTNADYLVGTANGTLTVEIVAGTAPGGSLGGTWASPTIDDLFLKNDADDTTSGIITAAGFISTGTGTFTTLKFGTGGLNLLPAGTGANNQILKTDASGVITWQADADSGGGGNTSFDGTSPNALLYIKSGNTAAGAPLTLWDNAQGQLNVGSGSTGNSSTLYIRGAGTAATFALRIANSTPTDRLVVLDNGNVGIGLTNPSQKLDIIGNILASGTIAGDILTGTNVTSGANPGHTHTGTSLSSIDISADTNLAVTAPVVLTDDTLSLTVAKDIVAGVGLSGGEDNVLPGADADTTLTFDATELDALTWDAGTLGLIKWDWNLSAGDPAMTFGNNYVSISTGNLGVGNTAPQALLDVGTSPGIGLIVLGGGNVGIGTTAPAQKLDIIGTMRQSGTVTLAQLNILNPDAGNTTPGMVLDVAQACTIDRIDAQVNGGTNIIFRVRQFTAGTTTPLYSLVTGQTATASALVINSASITGPTVPANNLIVLDVTNESGTVPGFRLSIYGRRGY